MALMRDLAIEARSSNEKAIARRLFRTKDLKRELVALPHKSI